MTDLLGPEQLRPAQDACPYCPCCTAVLCAHGRLCVAECHGLTSRERAETVFGCPCSSRLTRGTHAWRAERVRVTRLATETPLPAALEARLAVLESTGSAGTDEQALAVLRVAGLTSEDRAGTHAVTELGRLYLAVKCDRRAETAVEVRSINLVARTVSAVVVGWHSRRLVTVLMDQLIAEVGPDVEGLSGVVLRAEANCQAETAEDVVLTKIRRMPAPLPAGMVRGDETVALRKVELGSKRVASAPSIEAAVAVVGGAA